MIGAAGSPGRRKYAWSECASPSSTVRAAAARAWASTCPPNTRVVPMSTLWPRNRLVSRVSSVRWSISSWTMLPMSRSSSGGPEHRHLLAALGRLEHHLHPVADLHLVEVGVHDVGEHGGALVERHVRDRVRHRHPAGGRHAVDRALARRLDPAHVVAATMRAEGPRIPVGLST